jgi:hypothetical protein
MPSGTLLVAANKKADLILVQRRLWIQRRQFLIIGQCGIGVAGRQMRLGRSFQLRNSLRVQASGNQEYEDAKSQLQISS